MAKRVNSNQADPNDPKIYRETLGSFGTTTKPGGNQLVELQTKVRQGIKHVELHLSNAGKGEFNVQDVPDKYGFEQRRTIMQLAKLNQQTLSVHGTFNVTSFSGLSNNGFSEANRLKNQKEIDETVKFAAETAKGGAVVFHLHESAITTPPGEINLPKKYLEKLKNGTAKQQEEYKRIEENYLNKNPLKRLFVDNPELEREIKIEYEQLSDAEKNRFKDWEAYYIKKKYDQIRLAPDLNPLIVVGDEIKKVERERGFVNVSSLKTLSDDDRNILQKTFNVKTDLKRMNINDLRKLEAIFTNGLPKQFKNKIDSDNFEKLKKKIYMEYEDAMENNMYMQAQADQEFFEKQLESNIEMLKLQKTELETKYMVYKDEIEKIKEIEEETREYVKKIENFNEKEGDLKSGTVLEILRAKLSKKNQEKEALIGSMGYYEYQQLDRHDESVAKINKELTELEDKKNNVKSITDKIFEKNANSLGDLGLKAMEYQLDLKKKADSAKQAQEAQTKIIRSLEDEYVKANSQKEKNEIHAKIMRAKHDLRLKTGLSDYSDIDIENKPLYIAPENIMAGYGYMDSLEEYKAVIRESWEKFADKLLSNQESANELKKKFESLTKKPIKTREDAIEIAKKHIAGTFDNAHAGVWLKYFRRKSGESDEERLREFNKWLNSEAESMVKEGIVKHIHFNDTQAKDDDHNLLGSGILDIHDLRERLRRSGVKEALIVEAGGRGADRVMHILNAFDIFNPGLRNSDIEGPSGYGNVLEVGEGGGSGVSDWTTVRRSYENRPQFSQYGLSYNTFTPQQPKGGQLRGHWSGIGFF